MQPDGGSPNMLTFLGGNIFTGASPLPLFSCMATCNIAFIRAIYRTLRIAALRGVRQVCAEAGVWRGAGQRLQGGQSHRGRAGRPRRKPYPTVRTKKKRKRNFEKENKI